MGAPPTPISVLRESHEKMLKFQEDHRGQAAPYRFLMGAFDLKSTSAVHHRMKILEEMGYVKPVIFGVRPRYIAIPKIFITRRNENGLVE